MRRVSRHGRAGGGEGEEQANPHIDPHKSHLGEIACTACHQGHQASKVYCLGCHTNFAMTIPGGDR